MATPYEFRVDDLPLIVERWFAVTDNAEHAFYAIVQAALARRNYFGVAATEAPAKAKAKAPAPSPHEVGLKLRADWLASVEAAGQSDVGANVGAQAESAEANALRSFIRDLHAEISGIKRGTPGKKLGKLRTLEELGTVAGLKASARDLAVFLGNEEVQAALAPFGIGTADRDELRALERAWDKARGVKHGTRAKHRGKRRKDIDARQALVDWLGVWWAIAKVRLKSEPDALKALGVDTRGKRTKAREVMQPPAPPASAKPAAEAAPEPPPPDGKADLAQEQA